MSLSNFSKHKIPKRIPNKSAFSFFSIIKNIFYFFIIYCISVTSFIYFSSDNDHFDYKVIKINKKGFLENELERIAKIKDQDPSVIEDMAVMLINSLDSKIKTDGGKINNNNNLPGRISYYISPSLPIIRYSYIVPIIYSENKYKNIDNIYVGFYLKNNDNLSFLGVQNDEKWTGGNGLRSENFYKIEQDIVNKNLSVFDAYKKKISYNDKDIVHDNYKNIDPISLILSTFENKTKIKLKKSDIIATPVEINEISDSAPTKLLSFYPKKIASISNDSNGDIKNPYINLEINNFKVQNEGKDILFFIKITDIFRKDKKYYVNIDNNLFYLTDNIINAIELSIYETVYTDIRKNYQKQIDIQLNNGNFNPKNVINNVNFFYNSVKSNKKNSAETNNIAEINTQESYQKIENKDDN